MAKKELLGYSIHFKETKDAKNFYKKVPHGIETKYIKAENEVILLEVEQIRKNDFNYIFGKGKERLEVDPGKIIMVEALYVRD